MKSIKEAQNLKGKKVLVRVDFNVPVGDDGVVDEKEDWRIKATLPTIKYLLEKEAKIILM
ncbi:MAG: phosphoglycerate kinase, partial [Candidatus Pacebacteria bacterium]|nr:phosphoglycerate kinase [Candidatus Paceibacterota bacterium]